MSDTERMRRHLEYLQEVYTCSTSPMKMIMDHAENTEDFVRGMRYMMRMQPGPLVEGYTVLLDYLKMVQGIANSYHTAIGTILRQEKHEVSPYE